MDILISDPNLSELIEKGTNKHYRKVERIKSLKNGLLRAINVMQSVENVDQLSYFSYLRYERLKHQYSGKSSVRLCNGFVHRLIFTEHLNGVKVELLEIDDTHYGNKK